MNKKELAYKLYVEGYRPVFTYTNSNRIDFRYDFIKETYSSYEGLREIGEVTKERFLNAKDTFVDAWLTTYFNDNIKEIVDKIKTPRLDRKWNRIKEHNTYLN